MTSAGVSRALGIVLGHLADRRFGDPRRGHPVALFGSAAMALEKRTYADSRGRGVVHLALLVGTVAGGGLVLERRSRDHVVAHTLLTAAATWTVLGGTSLGREAAAVHDLLAADDLPGARQRLTHLVGRDTSVLDASEVSRATVESVAENTSDAVVAPLVWGALLGIPGLLGYRAANTLDAMVGHRGERYGRFGWASARFDDLLNLPGARLSGLLAAALAPLVGGRPSAAIRAWRSDARRHPSPNAGRRRGRLRRRARRTARRSQPLRPRHRGPRAAGRRSTADAGRHRPRGAAGRRCRHRRRRGRVRRRGRTTPLSSTNVGSSRLGRAPRA